MRVPGLMLMAMILMMLPQQVYASQIGPELWDRPRSAQTVMAQPAVRQAVVAYQGRSSSRIVITHGTRQEALLQAEELRAWLVALAVDSARLQLRVDQAIKGISIAVME